MTVSKGWRPRAVAGLLYALVGTSGVLLGAALDRFLVHRRAVHGFLGGRGPHEPPLEMRTHLVRWLASKLDLTDAQRTQVDSILTRQDSTLHLLMGEMRPRFEGLATETHAKIETVLTPGQRDRFRKLGPHVPFPPFPDSGSGEERPHFPP